MQFVRLLAAGYAAVAIATLMACNPSTGPTNVTLPNAVDSLRATSINATTVRLRWTAPASPGITGYRVTVVNTMSGAVIGTTNTASTIIDITGLTAGVIYAFRVQSRNADTVSAMREIRWSPAVRITTMQGGPIRIYETASGFGSGLGIQGGVALNLTVARGADWDIGIATRSPDTLLIGSPGGLGYSAIVRSAQNDTRTGDNLYLNVDSLNQVFDTQIQMGAPGVFPIPLRTITRGFVLAIQTRAGNFAKIFVKSASGVILQGTSPNRYIEVEVSYQPTPNVPYAHVPTFSVEKGLIDARTFGVLATFEESTR
ncbi:MAG: fibronectin type III domain-containing protein [Bacteroidota bacterium]|nr:fibronectin type III domain-containing protein [Candidatus Kapabacteria bacterium]MDW8220799.1 fibronectin type III domain-containing protein [Bacteroidota bacterium]